MTVKLSSLIAPHFHNNFNSRKVHQIYEGGRGSTKTSRNALRLATAMIEDDNCNIVVVRRHKNTLRNSAFQELKLAFTRLGLSEGIDYNATVSPLKITVNLNGNTAYFGGLDNYEKLKGMIADQDTNAIRDNMHHVYSPDDLAADVAEAPVQAQIKYLWLMEITEFKQEEDILQTIATFSRGDKEYFCILYEYNPPKNKYHWINEWKDDMATKKDVLVHHSDYRTVPKEWLGQVFISIAENLKQHDENRYNHIYLGEVTGLDGLIYNYDLLNVIEHKEELPREFELLEGEEIVNLDYYIDTGHQVSATSYLCIAYTSKARIILLDTYYYSPHGKAVKKAPSEFSADLWLFIQDTQFRFRSQTDKYIIDSAEGGMRNQFFKDFGIRLTPVAKTDKEIMIDHVQGLFALGNFYVVNNKNNEIFLTEHKNYKWKEGSIEAGKPVPDKSEQNLKVKYYNSHSESLSYYYADHTCDPLQYGVIMNLRKYGLKY